MSGTFWEVRVTEDLEGGHAHTQTSILLGRHSTYFLLGS